MNRIHHAAGILLASRLKRASRLVPFLALCALLPGTSAYGDVGSSFDGIQPLDNKSTGAQQMIAPGRGGLSNEVARVARQVAALSNEVVRVADLVVALPAELDKAAPRLDKSLQSHFDQLAEAVACPTNMLATLLLQVEVAQGDLAAINNQIARLVQRLEVQSDSTENPPLPSQPDPAMAGKIDSLSNALEGLSLRISGNFPQLSRKLDEAQEAREQMDKRVVYRLKLLVVLAVCIVVMLIALGAVVFFGSRSSEPLVSRPKPSGGSDAPSDWRAQLDAARAAEQQAKRDAQSAREAERVALERAGAAREAEKKAVDSLRQIGDAADEAEKAARAAVRAALSAFASCRGLDENAWLVAIRDIARGLSKVSDARNASPKEGYDLLLKWSRFLSEFSTPDRTFDLNLPAIGADVDTSWMTPARAGTAKVTRVLTWAVYTNNGVRHNAEVE